MVRFLIRERSLLEGSTYSDLIVKGGALVRGWGLFEPRHTQQRKWLHKMFKN